MAKKLSRWSKFRAGYRRIFEHDIGKCGSTFSSIQGVKPKISIGVRNFATHNLHVKFFNKCEHLWYK